jgi:hypothetical protein
MFSIVWSWMIPHHKAMKRPAAAIAPMINSLFSTCAAAPVEVPPDEVGPVWVLVTVSVAVRIAPVAVVMTIPVDVTTDSVPEAEAEIEVEAKSDSAPLVVLIGIVEPPAIPRALEVSWAAAEEVVVQGAFAHQSVIPEKNLQRNLPMVTLTPAQMVEKALMAAS